MSLHTLSLLVRGSVNPGIVAGSVVATTEENENNKNLSTKGRIIGAVTGAILLVVIVVIAVCYDRGQKRKARQGSKLRDTGAGEYEAVPVVYGPVWIQRPSMVQPGGAFFPPQEERNACWEWLSTGSNASASWATGNANL